MANHKRGTSSHTKQSKTKPKIKKDLHTATAAQADSTPFSTDHDPFAHAQSLLAYLNTLKSNDILKGLCPANSHGKEFSPVDPMTMQKTLIEGLQHSLQEAGPLTQATKAYLNDLGLLWQKMLYASPAPTNDKHDTPVITPHQKDKRFRAEEWETIPYFNLIKQNYLLWDRWLQGAFSNLHGLDAEQQKRINFYVRQLRDAMAPVNFPWLNPDVIKKTLMTGGQNLLQGLENLGRDYDKEDGQLNIQITDPDAFTVGKNLAITPGKVVFQNDLIQLIQYTPTTEKVAAIPVVIVPPCINKFYIFDLRPENSFVKWLVAQGLTVFMISWINPDARLAHKTFDDYVLDGVGQAIQVAREIAGTEQVNAIGFCIGGAILTSLSGYYAAQPQLPNPLASTTYLASLFDFSKAGELSVFIDQEQLQNLENQMRRQGYMDGRVLARTFNSLRANDLVWSYVITNYYLGETPAAFDFLHWNSDYTNLPATMYSTYLRQFFFDNALIKDDVTVKGVPIKLKAIKTPVFLLNTKEDHIAPWQSGYAGMAHFQGPKKFVLGGSGHVVGIFNPPYRNKYNYYVNDDLPDNPNYWLSHATEKAGSWWTEWLNWLQDYKGKEVPARQPGSPKYQPFEDAPGSFVLSAPGDKSHDRSKT
jgi:poly(R)-hydroxyalkanoic acid synthase, class I